MSTLEFEYEFSSINKIENFYTVRFTLPEGFYSNNPVCSLLDYSG